MQFNLYITIKSEGRTPRAQERLVREAFSHGTALMDILPDIDEIVQLHEDSEVLIQLNRSE